MKKGGSLAHPSSKLLGWQRKQNTILDGVCVCVCAWMCASLNLPSFAGRKRRTSFSSQWKCENGESFPSAASLVLLRLAPWRLSFCRYYQRKQESALVIPQDSSSSASSSSFLPSWVLTLDRAQRQFYYVDQTVFAHFLNINQLTHFKF